MKEGLHQDLEALTIDENTIQSVENAILQGVQQNCQRFSFVHSSFTYSESVICFSVALAMQIVKLTLILFMHCRPKYCRRAESN